MKQMGSELHDAGKEMDRLKALSDGVFAIVLTLPVLELKIPHIKTHVEVLQVLGSLAPAFVSYVLSFFIIGLYWIVHTRIVRHMTRLRPRHFVAKLILPVFHLRPPVFYRAIGPEPPRFPPPATVGTPPIQSGSATRGCAFYS